MATIDFDKLKDTFKLHNHTPKVFIFPFLITFISSSIMFIFYKFNQYIPIWDKFSQADGNATTFCELNHFDQLIVQPSNTWSNIGFIIGGLIILSINKNDTKYYGKNTINNLLTKYPHFSYLFGGTLLFLGLSSFIYHASLTYFFQKLDITGMYFVLISAITYNVYKLFPHIRFKNVVFSSHKFMITCGLALMLFFYLYLWKLPLNIVFPSLVLVFFFMNLYVYAKVKHSIPIKGVLITSFVTISISFTFWILDKTSLLCSPSSPFQGHALWHILNATSIVLLYFYYRSEDFIPEEMNVLQPKSK